MLLLLERIQLGETGDSSSAGLIKTGEIRAAIFEAERLKTEIRENAGPRHCQAKYKVTKPLASHGSVLHPAQYLDTGLRGATSNEE
jgi:hypothetical protein